MKKVKANPAKVILGSYIGLIGAGFLLFVLLPTTEREVSCIDLLFTVTSAVTVTGLVVLDPATDITPLGQVLLLVLIQIGGIGYMTLTTFFLVLVGKRIGLRERLILSESLGYPGLFGLVRFLKRVVLFVVLAETLGTLMLTLMWLGDMDPLEAFWMALFHSVSAFNNAGFSILPGGFGAHINGLPALMVFAVLIVLGGLGFYVVQDLLLFARGKVPRLSTHTKVVLLSTSVLLICGSALLLLTEAGHKGGVADMLFLSVSSRTAGFSTTDLSQLSESTLFLLIILMFIGASPGGTGGGVKTVTFTLITVAVFSYIRGREEVVLFGRSVPQEQIYRAMVIILLSTAYIVAVNLAIDRIEEKDFLATLFEVVSAFSTVGLSLGDNLSFSSQLSIPSKMLIILTMVVGRVGILSFALAIAYGERRSRLKHPEARLLV
ncbi:MAG: potassium transporter TrkG [Aquificota bacterium]|nr:potassium transporter TrkG [Aquificota bacterium]